MNTPLQHVYPTIPFYQLNVTASDSAIAAGGTAAQNHWTSLINTQLLGVKITYDSHDAGYLSQIVIEQAQDAIGTGLKALNTYTLSPTAINATAEAVSVNVAAAQLDTVNNYQFVRVRLVQTGGAATNKFTVIYVSAAARFQYLIGHDPYTLRLPQDQNPDGQ